MMEYSNDEGEWLTTTIIRGSSFETVQVRKLFQTSCKRLD